MYLLNLLFLLPALVDSEEPAIQTNIEFQLLKTSESNDHERHRQKLHFVNINEDLVFSCHYSIVRHQSDGIPHDKFDTATFTFRAMKIGKSFGQDEMLVNKIVTEGSFDENEKVRSVFVGRSSLTVDPKSENTFTVTKSGLVVWWETYNNETSIFHVVFTFGCQADRDISGRHFCKVDYLVPLPEMKTIKQSAKLTSRFILIEIYVPPGGLGRNLSMFAYTKGLQGEYGFVGQVDTSILILCRLPDAGSPPANLSFTLHGKTEQKLKAHDLMYAPAPKKSGAVMFKVVGTTLRLRREMNGLILSCSASNWPGRSVTRMMIITVHFPPQQPVYRPTKDVYEIGDRIECRCKASPKPRVWWNRDTKLSRLHVNESFLELKDDTMAGHHTYTCFCANKMGKTHVTANIIVSRSIYSTTFNDNYIDQIIFLFTIVFGYLMARYYIYWRNVYRFYL